VQKTSKSFVFIKSLLPALIWSGIIFYMISVPSDNIPESRILKIENIDKLIHFSMFFVLTILLCFGFLMQTAFKKVNKFYIAYAISISIIYGALTEIMQELFFDSRSADKWDFVANTFGAIAGLFVFIFLIKSKIKIFRHNI